MDDDVVFTTMPWWLRPQPSRSSPKFVEDPRDRALRVERWRQHYESGAGFREAEAEAWQIVRRRNFARYGFQEAAQHVGWSVRRLVWSFKRQGRKLPNSLRRWASAQAERYKEET